jgi:hypothetical protein
LRCRLFGIIPLTESVGYLLRVRVGRWYVKALVSIAMLDNLHATA